MVVIMNHRFGSCHVESTASPFADCHFAYGQLIISQQSARSLLLALFLRHETRLAQATINGSCCLALGLCIFIMKKNLDIGVK